jgi:RNA polymerase sigma-70 factor, ECF subfamily
LLGDYDDSKYWKYRSHPSFIGGFFDDGGCHFCPVAHGCPDGSLCSDGYVLGVYGAFWNMPWLQIDGEIYLSRGDALTLSAHRDVLEAAAQGDNEALAVLVRAYHDRIYRFGLRVCRDGFDADDAVQEAFAKLAKRPEVVRDPSALSWLMTVVRNTCLRMLRPFTREKRVLGERIADSEELASDSLSPQQALERWELIDQVHQSIASLERPYREVLIMRDLEGMTGEETCTALGLESATMKTRLHRARTQLREQLALRGLHPNQESHLCLQAKVS